MTLRGSALLPLGAVLLMAALVVGGATGLSLQNGGSTVDAFESGVGALAAAGIVVLSFTVRPAWPLSLGLAAAAFSGHWQDMGIPVAVDRLLLLSAIAAVVLREARARSHALRSEPVHWLLAVVGLYALVSAVLVGTLDDEVSRFALLDRFSLVAFGLFFVAPVAFRDPVDRQILLGVLVALGAYLGLTALVETVGPRGLLFPRYIDDPTVGIHFDRARGPFTESVGNGLVMTACGIAAGIAAVTWRDRRLRGLAALVVGLCALGALLTLTRAVWLGAVVGTVALLASTGQTRRFLGPALVLGLVTVLAAFAVIPGLGGRAEARTNDDRPLWDRQNSNAAAARMLSERPTLGFGWGEFRLESLAYYRQGPDYPLTFVTDVHNVYLSNAVELGVLGASLWLLALLIAVVTGIRLRGPPELRPWKIGLVGVAAGYLVAAGTTPLAFTLPTLLLWTWAGLARGPRTATRRPEALPS